MVLRRDDGRHGGREGSAAEARQGERVSGMSERGGAGTSTGGCW